MEMTYDEALVMPSNCTLMDEEEMQYLEGGGKLTINTNILAGIIDVACTLSGFYASAIAELGTRAIIAGVKAVWKNVRKKVAQVLGSVAASTIGYAVGKFNTVAGYMMSCTSFGGIIGLLVDTLDGKMNSKHTIRW